MFEIFVYVCVEMDVFGSHNARYCSGFLERRRQAGADTSLVVVVPLGVTVVEWDVATRTRRTLARVSIQPSMPACDKSPHAIRATRGSSSS